MRVVVTGAAGFIGSHLVEALLSRGSLTNTRGERAAVTELVLIDVHEPTLPTRASDIVIETRLGDICDPSLRKSVFSRPVHVIFHLAAALAVEAQADPARGTQVNVRGMLDLLEACHDQQQPKFVFASSIATFGGPLPQIVDDSVAQNPQTSYGAHKLIAEQLINDYSRHGLIDGRALRLPIVLVRPPSASPSISDHVAAIVREPLAGRDFVCPLRDDTKLTVASVHRVAQALIDISEASKDIFVHSRAVNFPALTVTPAEMVAAVEAAAAGTSLGRVSYSPDASSQAIVDSWPQHFVSHTASQAGLSSDTSFVAIVESYLNREQPKK